MYGYIFYEYFIIYMVFVFGLGFKSFILWCCIYMLLKKEKLVL